MRFRFVVCLFVLTVLLSGVLPVGAQTPVQQVKKPNFDIHLYRRAGTPDEKIMLNLSAFNEKTIRFSIHRFALPTLVPTSKALEKFGEQIKTVNVAKLPAVKSWTFGMGKIYPDQWTERQVAVPSLPPGTYLVQARAGNVEKRTWLAVTNIALLAKRSRQELLLYATNAHSGQPIPNLKLDCVDAIGKHSATVTDNQGACHLPCAAEQANMWVYGEKNGSPAFVISGTPPPPEPYAVYVVTDRPIYRPGHKVQFKGTVRQRFEADAPGGFTYGVFANKALNVEIRDATDALLSRQTVTTNANGSFDGAFQLAGEPTLGNWQICVAVGAFRAYGAFSVEAYRKPEFSAEVKFAQSHYLGSATVPVTIDVRYYFGQPVSGASVAYTIQFQPEYSANMRSDGTPANPEPAYNGQGITDAQGQLKLDIRTQRLPLNRRLSIHATVTDLSRRSQQADGNTLITGGMFHLRLETDKSVYRAGERMTVGIHAEDYDGKPVATPARVLLIETKYDRSHRPYKETTTRNVNTDAAGVGAANFAPPRPGYLLLQVEAFDTDHNKIQSELYVWVAGDEAETYDYPTLNLLPDRTAYRPGDTATLLLNTSLVSPAQRETRRQGDKEKRRLNTEHRIPNTEHPTYSHAWALVTVEGERLYSVRVVPIFSRSTMIQVPLTGSYFPSVEVNVTLVQEKQIYQQQARLTVQRDAQKLNVQVTPDKTRYQPGETATYTVSTRNSAGLPVAAEIGFGVVDASIYAIQPDRAPNIGDFFYAGQQIRVQTDFSFAAQYSGGAFQTVPQPAPGTPPASGANIRVRRQFADTAYWNPFVATDGSGRAQVSFVMPDNLTTWRATARAITTQTLVGSATRDVTATMPLLVRLTLPRFYVQGDQATVSAIVHNYTGVERDIRAHIETTGADLDGGTNRNLHLMPNSDQRLDWTAHIRKTPDNAAAPVRFVVTADGGTGAQDAMELTLPAQEDGVKQVDSKAETLDETNSAYSLDLTRLPPNATVTLTLAPSLASATLDALGYLTTYPYGCAEQTMSSFLPDVIVARAFKRLGSNRPVNPNLAQWVNLGLQKLYRYQHPDGGWNWWEFDQTDGDMTAYVLWGLVQARNAGYIVDEQRILRGTESLLRLLNGEQEWNRRADWLLTLSYAAPNRIVVPLTNLYDNRDKLDTYSLASLCLSLAQENGVTLNNARLPNNAGLPPNAVLPNFRTIADGVAQELEAKVVEQGTTAHWPAAVGGYTWRNDDVEVTARVVRALLTSRPRSPLIARAVRWLMGNRAGKAWASTRSSAEAVFALAQWMEQSNELHPAFQATVKLDGQTLQTFAPTPAQVFDAPLTVTLTPALRAGHQTLTIDRQGAGRLYVTTNTAYTIPSETAQILHRGIAAQRYYHIQAVDPSRADGIASGQTMEVQVEITADANYRYAMLEEPIPAGCEVEPGDDQFRPSGLVYEEGGGGYARQETRDNRVVFFFDSLPKGKTRLTYRLHAETPGLYHILPSLASLVYFPEIRGNGLPVHARITER